MKTKSMSQSTVLKVHVLIGQLLDLAAFVLAALSIVANASAQTVARAARKIFWRV